MPPINRLPREWWDESLPRYNAFVSVLVLDEISRGNVDEAKRRLESVSEFSLLSITSAVGKLADIYFLRLNIPQKARPDSYHLALAAWHGMDYLVTWNCAHIANARLKKSWKRSMLSRE